MLTFPSESIRVVPLRLLAFFLCILFALPVAAQTRHALVIGIDKYVEVTPLEKAVNDARAVEAALTQAGVKTTLVTDPGQRAFNTAIEDFSASLSPGDEAIFFYAGHGIEDDGQNFLLPADVPKDKGRLTVRGESVALDTIMAAFQDRGARVSVFIIDACRDNPFASGTRSIGGTRGLAAVREVAGTFVMFSAGQGESALDRLPGEDTAPNSVFTRVLLPRLSEPGLDLRQMATEVRREVRDLAGTAGHSQFPAVYDQLAGDFTLIPAAATSASTAAAPQVADPCIAARADWTLVAGSNSESTLATFMTMHKDCPLTMALAKERISAIAPQQTAAAELPPAADTAPVVRAAPAAQPDPAATDPALAAFDRCKAAVDEVDVDDLAKNPALSQMIDDCRTAIAHPTQSGDAKAFLGRALYSDKNYDEAITWFRQAAEAGNTQAMNSIGVMFTYGRGVPKNDAEAVQWYRKAADAGNAAGMTNVGLMLEQGKGLKRDPAEAARYFVLGLRNGSRGFLDGYARWNVSRETRVELQRALTAEGVYSGTIDGSLGPASRAAMESLIARGN